MGWVMFRIGVSKCAVHVPNRIGKAGSQSTNKLREHNTIKKVILLQSHPSNYIKLILSTHSKKSESHHGVIIQFPSFLWFFTFFHLKNPSVSARPRHRTRPPGPAGAPLRGKRPPRCRCESQHLHRRPNAACTPWPVRNQHRKRVRMSLENTHTHIYIFICIYMWYHIMILYGIIWYLGIPSGYDIARASHGIYIYRWPIEIDGPYRT